MMDSSIKKIRSLPVVERLYHFNSIPSTNTYAKGLKELPAKGIVVVCADRQTAGRGQRQNTFFSGAKGGVFASLVCPIAGIEKHFNHNRAVSLAIYDAIKSVCPAARLSIKWPNDIYWGDKKVCGILLENIPQSNGHIVVGFGINVNIEMKTFPEDIRGIATSLLIETGKKHNEYALLRNILEWFWRYLGLDSAAAHMLYMHRLYKVGERCEVNGQKGVFEGVLEDGRMRLKIEDKEISLSSGPVRFNS
ncbi:MAG TPA: biotin--[acetyl-CoA-carboxylase] ligase [Chitinivibrionales bacterium]|nr:biotin--[acetyl-CoA-carboxylase] ligase [Chitinivibrionales bacterium]